MDRDTAGGSLVSGRSAKNAIRSALRARKKESAPEYSVKGRNLAFLRVIGALGMAASVLSLATVASLVLPVAPLAATASTFTMPGVFSPPQSIDRTGGGLQSVSCASATFCISVDTGGRALTWNGTSWSAPKSIDAGGGGFASVSCASATFCTALDGSGNALSFNGTSWSAPKLIDGSTNGLDSVSCASATFCAAVDYNGNALSWNGTSWSTPLSIDSSNTPTSVSCPTTSFCIAVDHNGNALSWALTPSVISIFPSTGTTSGGTKVTINGSGFTSVATVKFGSTAATSVSYKSAIQLVAVSPPESAGTV